MEVDTLRADISEVDVSKVDVMALPWPDCLSRWMAINHVFQAFLQWETSHVTFCLLPWMKKPFKMGSTLKEKNCPRRNKFFSSTLDSNQVGSQKLIKVDY